MTSKIEMHFIVLSFKSIFWRNQGLFLKDEMKGIITCFITYWLVQTSKRNSYCTWRAVIGTIT